MKKILLGNLLLVFSLAGCVPGWGSVASTQTASPDLPDVTVTSTTTSTSTATTTLPPTLTRTPPVLPGIFQASFLYEGDAPHTYIDDTCQYLHDKWASTSAAPGTVVMVIMFHSIGGETAGDRISDAGFHDLMETLYQNAFEAITTNQLADFMEFNARIPARSVLLVVDDRRSAIYYDTFFRPYNESYGWPVVNAWISLDDSIGQETLPEHVVLENEGWVDHQAHGVVHNTPMWPGVTDDYITSELQGSIDAFRLNFGKSPIAIIWPGGAFFERPVEIARELGYRLGFTVNPRGPLMYNWVPLADETDPGRPSWTPEGDMGDPLLVLPRYWDTDAVDKIGEVVQLNLDAAAYAEANRQTELDYYDITCSSTLGPLP